MAIDNESDMRRTCLPIFDTPSASSMSLSDAEWYMSPSLGTYNDMCLQIGKLSVTQRIGGVFRPNVVQELEAVLLSKARSCSGSQGTRTDLLLSTPLVAWFKRLPLANLLNPSDSTASIDGLYFPTRSECEFLVTQYFIAVDPIAHLLYKPAFEQDLLEMFRGTSSMVAESTRALILAVCFAAAVSLPLLRTQYSLGIAKAVLVDKLRTATERCLQLGNILGTCDVKMLQAVHIYLVSFHSV